MLPEKYNLRFTPRELTVCKYLILGYSVPEMADVFDISPNTVSGHLKSIKDKLNISKASRMVSALLNMGFTADLVNEIVYYNGVVINDDINSLS